jgi:hypothetical protein
MACIPISIGQAFNFAWPIFKQRFGLFTAVLLTIFSAWVTLEIVVIAGQRFGILLWAVMHLAFLIFVAGIEAGFLHICLVLFDGGEPTFADTFTRLPLGPKFLAGQILYLLMVVIGLLLLVVPGVYLSARYALSYRHECARGERFRAELGFFLAFVWPFSSCTQVNF